MSEACSTRPYRHLARTANRHIHPRYPSVSAPRRCYDHLVLQYMRWWAHALLVLDVCRNVVNASGALPPGVLQAWSLFLTICVGALLPNYMSFFKMLAMDSSREYAAALQVERAHAQSAKALVAARTHFLRCEWPHTRAHLPTRGYALAGKREVRYFRGAL